MLPRRSISALQALAVSALALNAHSARAEEPVTVSVQGERRPVGEIASEPFAATSRIEGERLTAPAARAPDILRSEVGVQIAEAGGLGAPATASIRGATAAQTPVYLGGVRLNDQVGGAADLSTVPLWLIQRVDVYRGNAPFEADEQGIGGAILFEPKKPAGKAVAAGGTLGSFGTRAGFGYFSAGDAHAGVLAGLSAEHADNDYSFNDNRGTLFQSGDDARRARANADSQLRDVWLVARARPSERARLELVLNDVTREQGVPKLALLPSRAARAELSRTLGAFTARLGLGPGGRERLTLQSAVLDGSTAIHDPERELGTLSQETALHGRRLQERAQLELPLSERWTASLMTNGNVETLERRDDASVSWAKTSTLRGATRLDWQASERFSVFGLVADQCRNVAPTGGGCRDAAPTGRVGAGFHGPGYTLFGNLSRYQREPTLGELFGAGVLVRGNDQLRSEAGVAADAGARGAWRSEQWALHGEASAFMRGASDLVTYARAAQGYIVPLNVGRARVSGLELGLGAQAFRHVGLDCNITLLDPRDTTPGRRLENDVLPFMSRLVVAPRLTLTSGDVAGRAFKRGDLSVDLSYLSNRFADAAGLIVIPEQVTLGATGAATWLSGLLVTRVRVANVLDTQRFDIVGYPLPGRSVYVSAEVKAP